MVAYAQIVDDLQEPLIKHVGSTSHIFDTKANSVNDGGEHGHNSFNNFKATKAHSTISSVAHKGASDTGSDCDKILARNISQDFVYNANNPWNMQQNSIFSQFVDKAFHTLGISSPVERQETIAFLDDVTKAKGFNAPVISEDTSQEEATRRIIEANPALFARSASTGNPVKLDDLAETCHMPAGIKNMCGGQGLPEELAIPMFAVHMDLNLEPRQTMSVNYGVPANYGAPAPTMMH